MPLDLHPGEEVIYDGHPSWRSIKAFYATGLVAALLIGAIFWLAASSAVGILAFVVVMAVTVIAGMIKRVFTRFTITSDRLTIERGILSKHVQQTRIDRVQNVNTRQSAIDRLFRVGSVDFDTAGTDGLGLHVRRRQRPRHGRRGRRPGPAPARPGAPRRGHADRRPLDGRESAHRETPKAPAMPGPSSQPQTRGARKGHAVAGAAIPAASARAAALSVRSHVKSWSSRPKWPYAAVFW